MSKAALNMYTRLLAKRLEDQKIRVSAFDPGWVRTDMGGNAATRSPEDAAFELVRLLESCDESGRFWKDGAVRDW